MRNPVTETAAAPPTLALEHFRSQFAFETDCWDVREALSRAHPGFVLLDVRGAEAYARGHVPGAIHLPHRKIIASALARWAEPTLFVTYCSGPHCNGAARAAVRLAALGRPVKLMAGGITGWIDEGFELAAGADRA